MKRTVFFSNGTVVPPEVTSTIRNPADSEAVTKSSMLAIGRSERGRVSGGKDGSDTSAVGILRDTRGGKAGTEFPDHEKGCRRSGCTHRIQAEN